MGIKCVSAYISKTGVDDVSGMVLSSVSFEGTWGDNIEG